MKYLHIYASADGESHFEDGEVETETTVVLPDHLPWELTPPTPCGSFIFIRRTEEAGVNDWHVVPQPQYVVRLSGDAELQASDGETRRVGPGTILLAEDTTGKGHRTVRAWGESTAVIIRLA